MFILAVEISTAQMSYSTENTSFVDFNTTPPSTPEQSPLFYHTQTSTLTIQNIKISGTRAQQNNFMRWLEGIAETQKGREILSKITTSGHQLHIAHSREAKLSAGRTIAPMTMDLINGKGASVKIIFDGNMNDKGSHFVYDEKLQYIEFTAYQNLFHELAHAAHQMNGTWRYFASEKQAIEEENVFRQEIAQLNNTPLNQRYGKWGEKITDITGNYSGL